MVYQDIIHGSIYRLYTQTELLDFSLAFHQKSFASHPEFASHLSPNPNGNQLWRITMGKSDIVFSIDPIIVENSFLSFQFI